MKKNIKLGISIFITLILTLSVAYALSQAPEQYWGYVKVENDVVSSGTLIVQSYTTGEVFVNQTIPYDGSSPGSYFFNLLFDDPLTEADEGANVSEPLTFIIDNMTAITPSSGSDTADVGGINNNFTIIGILNPSLAASVSYSANSTDINGTMVVTLTLNNTGQGTANATIANFTDNDLLPTGLPATLKIAKNSSNSTNITVKSLDCGTNSETLTTTYYNLAGSTIGTLSTTISIPTKGYDIELTSVDESSTSVTEGDTVNVTVRIDNEGDYNITSYTLYLYDNGDLINTEEVSLDIGTDEYAEKTYELNLSVGLHEISANVTLDETECSTSNNVENSSIITVSEEVIEEEVIVTVEETTAEIDSDELLARIQLDISRLEKTLSDGVTIAHINKDIDSSLTELNDYQDTVLNVRDSNVASNEKNKTYNSIEEKLDALEKVSIEKINDIKEKEYIVNSSLVDNFNITKDIADLNKNSTITVKVKLIEAESLSYETTYITKIEIKVDSGSANISLIAKMLDGLDIIYETGPETLEESLLSWDPEQPIIYYVNKDIYETAEDINYFLMPKDKTDESANLIQGFVVKEIEESKWNFIPIILLIILAISYLFYRFRIDGKGEQPELSIKTKALPLFRKQKDDIYKGAQKMRINELYKAWDNARIEEETGEGETIDTEDPDIKIIRPEKRIINVPFSLPRLEQKDQKIENKISEKSKENEQIKRNLNITEETKEPHLDNTEDIKPKEKISTEQENKPEEKLQEKIKPKKIHKPTVLNKLKEGYDGVYGKDESNNRINSDQAKNDQIDENKKPKRRYQLILDKLKKKSKTGISRLKTLGRLKDNK